MRMGSNLLTPYDSLATYAYRGGSIMNTEIADEVELAEANDV